MAAPTPNPSASIKLLLLEDNDISRQLMSEFLTDCGYTVLALSEAKSFSLILDQFQPNVVLLDLKLPEVDGYAVLELMQRHPTWQHIPVIVISAFAFDTDKQRALSLGARRYLVKPVKLTEVIEAIWAETTCLAI